MDKTKLRTEVFGKEFLTPLYKLAHPEFNLTANEASR